MVLVRYSLMTCGYSHRHWVSRWAYATTYSVGCLARFGAATGFSTACVGVAGFALVVDFGRAAWALACLTLASCFAGPEGACAIATIGHNRQTATGLSTIFFMSEFPRRAITKTAILGNQILAQILRLAGYKPWLSVFVGGHVGRAASRDSSRGHLSAAEI